MMKIIVTGTIQTVSISINDETIFFIHCLEIMITIIVTMTIDRDHLVFGSWVKLLGETHTDTHKHTRQSVFDWLRLVTFVLRLLMQRWFWFRSCWTVTMSVNQLEVEVEMHRNC